MGQHIQDIEEFKGELSKRLIKIVEIGDIKCNDNFDSIIQAKIEYNTVSISDYKIIFGEDSLHSEIGS